MKLFSDVSAAHAPASGAGNRRFVSSVLVMVALFVANVALVSPVFFPSLKDIGVWDEALYIQQGRELLHGTLPLFSANPASAVLYALTYLPVHNSPLWLVHSCSIGRFILFALLWCASALVATELENYVNRFVLIGIVVISPVLMFLLANGTDALFAAMSGFALWQFLSFLRARSIRHLWLCSLFLGLAALSRTEGPVLFIVFLGLSFAACFRSGQWKAVAIACLVPFIALTAGYVLLYGLRTGDFTTGNEARSYLAFEQGQGVAFADSYQGKAIYIEGALDARRLFGTGAENHYSVIKAISRNPRAYLARILPLTRTAIQDAISGFGWYVGLLCAAFAIRGIIYLLQKRAFLLLATFLFWSGYVLLYVLLNSQRSHLLMPFLSVFSLAAIGISAFVRNLDNRSERTIWLTGLIAFVVIAAARGTLPNGPLNASLIILAGLSIIWLASANFISGQNAPVFTSLALLSLGLVLRNLPEAKSRSLTSQADEQAAVYLETHFSPASRMAAWGPGKLFNAKMDPVIISVDQRELKTPQQLLDWMRNEKVQAIYVDDYLRQYEPDLWAIIQKGIGTGLVDAFHSADNAVEILVPQAAAQ